MQTLAPCMTPAQMIDTSNHENIRGVRIALALLAHANNLNISMVRKRYCQCCEADDRDARDDLVRELLVPGIAYEAYRKPYHKTTSYMLLYGQADLEV